MPHRGRPIPTQSKWVKQQFSPRSDRIQKAANQRTRLRGTKLRAQGGMRGGAPI